MKPAWDDVNARARGLATHLLNSDQLDALALQPDLPALAAALRPLGLLPATVSESPEPEEIELGLRRWAGELMAIMARWTGRRAAALPLVFDEEDRRSIRAVVRGAVQHAPAEARLAGLIPTPVLPERALEELAACSSVGAVGALLAAWQHPFAGALAGAAGITLPDLLRIELELARILVQRDLDAARRSRDRILRVLVRETIDIENATSAVLVSGHDPDVDIPSLFLEGGARLTLDAFTSAAGSVSPRDACLVIARALRPSPLSAVMSQHADKPAELDDALLRLRLLQLARRVRQAPLSVVTTVRMALRIRAQVIDLQRIVWTVALGGPRAWITELLTPVTA